MFKPNIYVPHVKDINYIELQKANKKLLCFDLDNTLDPADNMTVEIDVEVKNALERIENLGFHVYIISNNSIKERVDSFKTLSGLEGIHFARKPFQKNYVNNEVISSYNKDEVVFIGDKIITDIIGGNLYGSTTILVDPLVVKKKKWYTIIMNISEYIFCKIIRFKRGNYYHE
jgi:HAD superfamily phosphatase (TIGR01668 family)